MSITYRNASHPDESSSTVKTKGITRTMERAENSKNKQPMGTESVINVISLPAYRLLAAFPKPAKWLETGMCSLELLAQVEQHLWLNLLDTKFQDQIESGEMTCAQVLEQPSPWKLQERHVQALNYPGVRALIQNGIFSVHRFSTLHTKQLEALCSSVYLCRELEKGKLLPMAFLRVAPSKLDELVAGLEEPESVL